MGTHEDEALGTFDYRFPHDFRPFQAGFDAFVIPYPVSALVQLIDISAANADKPAGLAYAPGSLDQTNRSIYIAERGVDNGTDPNENDGKVYTGNWREGPGMRFLPDWPRFSSGVLKIKAEELAERS